MDEPRLQGPHELLLALAGRVDDDLLGWARELVAVGEHARAVELLTAALVADRAVLPDPVRTALVDAGQAARSDLDAELLPPSRPDDGTEHRFRAEAAGGVGDVAGALRGARPVRPQEPGAGPVAQAPPIDSDDTDRFPLTTAEDALRPPSQHADEQPPGPAQTPVFAAMQDPLTGPIRSPLLAPLLEPSAAGPDSWAAEWESGAWAMSSTALTEDRSPTAPPSPIGSPAPRSAGPGAGSPEPDSVIVVPPAVLDQPTGPARATRRSARHRHPDGPDDEEPPNDVTRHDRPGFTEPGDTASAAVRPGTSGPSPVPRTPGTTPAPHATPDLEVDGPALGLRPETLARLGPADRALLARLQDELGDGRRRVSRPAGVANGSRPGPTVPDGPDPYPGDDPPDLADR